MTQPMPVPVAHEPKYDRLPDEILLKAIDKAKSLLILDHPFFGASVAKRPLKFTTDIPTAGMTPRGQMYINLDFISELRLDSRPDKVHVPYIIFLLAHEAMHFMLLHGLRLKGRNAKAWNVACDKVINDTLEHNQVGEPIPEGVYMRDARKYAAEELYDENDDGGGDGPGGAGNDIMPDEGDGSGTPSEAEAHEIEATAKIESIQNAKAAKAMGKLPADIERLIDDIINVKTPWYDILERFMVGKIKDEPSWKKPNRRFMAQGIYLPSADDRPSMGNLVIAVDTSGSIGQAELNHFSGHVNRIMELCAPPKVYVVYCDSDINHVDEYETEDLPVVLTPHGGGGTAFEPVFDWVNENVTEDIDCLVYLTDGWANTNFEAPNFDTIWLSTDREADNWHWGEVVNYEIVEE